MSQMKASRMIRLTLVSTSVAAALMLAGCSVIAPEKLSSDDLMRLANVDQQLMFAAQEPPLRWKRLLPVRSSTTSNTAWP